MWSSEGAQSAQMSTFARQDTADPLAPLGHALQWSIELAVELSLATMLGLLAARLMRRSHVHWTWALVALASVLALCPMLGRPALVLGSTATVAAGIGRRWHRADVEAGADLADIAARRTRPQDVGARLARRAAAVAFRSGRQDAGAGERLVLGRDERDRAVSVPFACSTQGSHTLVVGATGAGKTVTQTLMAEHAIERGAGAIVVDPKGDRALHRELRRAAQRAGRQFLEWTPAGPSVYNPYARGSETEIADKVLASEHFTEPHYQRQAQRYLGHVVRALRTAGLEVSLREIADCLDPRRLEELVRDQPEQRALATHAYLDSLTARQRTDLAGVRDRLAIVAESDVAAWLDPASGAAFDLLAAALSRAVVYFDLQADSRPLVAQMLGGAIVQDLQTTVAALQGRPTPTLAVIDEFSALAVEQVVRLFGRARSAGVSLLLGTQELSDMRATGRDGVLEPVLGNLSVLVAHRQVVPDSTSLIAALGGTKGAWRTSRHGNGSLTRTRARENVLTPGDITALGTGWAAVIVLGDGSPARVARIHPPGARR
jgi:Type IV secretion-system coupling protein DNA-binding domain